MQPAVTCQILKLAGDVVEAHVSYLQVCCTALFGPCVVLHVALHMSICCFTLSPLPSCMARV